MNYSTVQRECDHLLSSSLLFSSLLFSSLPPNMPTNIDKEKEGGREGERESIKQQGVDGMGWMGGVAAF